MIRMILADDEPVIIRGIQKLVDFSQMGIEVVGEFTNGKSAMEGILRMKPDLALLDISMPEMSGVEILKECFHLELGTKIIFISGFQDFEYAKAALKYGALDYLLKPVIREELLRALEKYLNAMAQPGRIQEMRDDNTGTLVDYSGLIDVEVTSYVPVLAEVLFTGGDTAQMRKLVNFSLLSFLEETMEKERKGIVFQKDGRTAMVLKGMEKPECVEFLGELCRGAEKALQHKICFLGGRKVDSMGEIPAAYGECVGIEGYLFFMDQMEIPVIWYDQTGQSSSTDWERFSKLRERMMDSIVAGDRGMFEKQYRQFGILLSRIADGKKEDACFYLCTLIRMLEEKYQSLGFPGRNPDMREILEKGRQAASYGEMLEVYRQLSGEYLNQVKEGAKGGENKDFRKAKAYIEEHYAEDLTLAVLAEVVHMNPYYFSSFFKKNAGENFKDYLNKVRVQHAAALLTGTDQKAYEVAAKVGFGDARIFSENFQKYYHETPNGFRRKRKQQ